MVAWSLKDTQGRLSLFRNGEFLGSQGVRLNAGNVSGISQLPLSLVSSTTTYAGE